MGTFIRRPPERPESAEAIVADLIFIVPRTELKWYGYLKQIYADESRDVVLDRRMGERRRSPRPPPVMERRHSERRHRDITWELQSAGWALVRRPVKRPNPSCDRFP